MDNKPRILITNDDGINSPGLFELVNELKKFADVIVVAPESQQSAVSSAVTVNKPLRVHKFFKDGTFFGYTVDGTPTDCVKLALNNLLDFKPDLVVSGINHGKNTAINVLYSGTVAGAIEGMLGGIKSIATSVDTHNWEHNCQASAEYTAEIAKVVLATDIPSDTLINVNIPATEKSEIKGIKVTKLSDAKWNDVYDKREDPFKRAYYWFAGEYTFSNNDDETDDKFLAEGWITVTPLKFDFTNLDFFHILKSSFKS